MKILFVTTIDPTKQGDLLEVNVLNGLRKLLGPNCIDFPKKKIMYHDWSETKKHTLHGMGFTLLTSPIDDIPDNLRSFDGIDMILYANVGQYDPFELDFVNKLVKKENIWYLDGHDLYGRAPNMIQYNGETVIGIQKKPCFKRELLSEEDSVYSTGLGVPSRSIKPINFSIKDQLHQKAVPNLCFFLPETDLSNRSNYKFDNEDDYHFDLQRSWFGLTCRRGGWDALRHYEIIANGTLLLFRDYDKKPPLCSPQNLPCFSYSSTNELESLVGRLLVDGKPTQEYLEMIFKQREWLLRHGTAEARALHIIQTMVKNKK